MALTFRSIGAATEVASGNLTFTEPAGAAQGDLLVVAIDYRSTAAFTPNDAGDPTVNPGKWQAVATQQSSGNTSTTTNASIASGAMFWTIRGASAPDMQFNRTAGDLALGRIAAYVPASGDVITLDAGSANTLGSNSATVTTTGITTAADDELLVMACCLADNTTASAQQAATDPLTNIWIERADSNSATGADGGLAVADAIKGEAGATGTLQYTAGNSSRHVCMVGAFKATNTTRPKFKKKATGTVINSASNVVTGSFTPGANALLIAVCATDANAGTLASAGPITDSDGSLTWTAIMHNRDTYFASGGDRSISTWWAKAPASPGSMTVTVNPPATCSAILQVFEAPGADTTSPIGATISNTHITDTQSITLNATPADSSLILSLISNYDISATVSRQAQAEVGWSEFTDQLTTDGAGLENQLAAQVRWGGTGTGVTWADAMLAATVATDDATVTQAFEIKLAASTNPTPALFANAQSFFAPKIKIGLNPSLFANAQVFPSPHVTGLVRPALYSNAQAFFAPKVNRTLKPALFTNAQTFPAHKIAARVKPAVLVNAQTFFAPKLALTIKPSLFANGQSFYVPVLVAAVIIHPALFTNAQSFPAPSLRFTVKPGAHTNAQGFFAHKIALTLKPAAFVNAQTFSAPKIKATLKPALFTNAQGFYTHSVSVGGTTKLPALFVNLQAFHAPTIRITVKPALFAGAQSFYAAKIKTTIKPAAHVNAQTFFGPKVRFTIKPAAYANAQTFPALKLATRVKPSALVNAQGFFTHSLRRTVKPSAFINAQAFASPQLRFTIKPAALINAQAFFGPTIGAPAVVLTPARFVNVQTFHAPTIVFGFELTDVVPRIPLVDRRPRPNIAVRFGHREHIAETDRASCAGRSRAWLVDGPIERNVP